MAIKTLIIGGTGAQGIPIIQELTKDGKYHVRVLSRDIEAQRAKDLQKKYGVELVKGDVLSDDDLKKAFEGIEAVFVNTDTLTLGEKNELYAGIRIFELAVQAKSVKQFIWSTLPYLIKEDGYNDRYDAAHYSTKGRVASGQPGGEKNYPGLKYSFFSTCPYMEQLHDFISPIFRDGIYYFEIPLKNGHIPFIALADVGKYVRYQFDHFDDFVGKTLEASSEDVGLKYLADTYTKVTGRPAQGKTITSNEFYAQLPDDTPVDGTQRTHVERALRSLVGNIRR